MNHLTQNCEASCGLCPGDAAILSEPVPASAKRRVISAMGSGYVAYVEWDSEHGQTGIYVSGATFQDAQRRLESAILERMEVAK